MMSSLRRTHSAQQQRAARGWSESVAIVGLGARFPGGIEAARSFWNLLAGGHDAIGDVLADRWNGEAFYDPDPATPGFLAANARSLLPLALARGVVTEGEVVLDGLADRLAGELQAAKATAWTAELVRAWPGCRGAPIRSQAVRPPSGTFPGLDRMHRGGLLR